MEKTADEYLADIPMWTRKKNSLEDIRAFLERMDNPDEKRKIIHVAGTNGKGSVCAYITSMLMAGGYHTGAFISPHLTDVRERFLFDGEPVGKELFEDSFREIRDLSERMMGEGYCHPSYFEFLFYMAMVLFRMHDVDVMILETGMGGRLDTTNVLERPAACVITSISMDHTRYLGDTLAKIAGEKAGIIKTGVPLVFDDGQPEVSTILEGFAFRKGAARYPVGRDDFYVEEIGEKGLSINARMKDGRCLELEIPFEAFYQAENAMLAVRTLDVLRYPGECPRTGCRMPGHGPCICPDGKEWGISDQHIIKGLKNTFWPGRMEQVMPGIYLDGAHNPGGIEAFIQTAGEISDRQGKKPWLLFAAVSDKDYERMAEQLCREMIWEAVGVVHMNSDRGLAAEELARVFRTYTSRPVYSYGDTKSAVEDMAEKSREGLLFCAGSLYLIGEIKAVLEQKS